MTQKCPKCSKSHEDGEKWIHWNYATDSGMTNGYATYLCCNKDNK